MNKVLLIKSRLEYVQLALFGIYRYSTLPQKLWIGKRDYFTDRGEAKVQISRQKKWSIVSQNTSNINRYCLYNVAADSENQLSI